MERWLGLQELVVGAIALTNSIMFPVVFTLTSKRSTAGWAATSGILCAGIVGVLLRADVPVLGRCDGDIHC